MGMGIIMKRNKYLSSMIIILLLLVCVLSPFAVAWWNGDWDYYRTITIDSDFIDSELTNFPILVSISDEIGDKCKANGEDIVFTLTDNETTLNHEIEKWVDNEDRIVWVTIPTISSTVDTVILMYYGNSGASDSQNPSGVWDSNFLGVYHLGDTTSTCADSTGYGNDGTYIGDLPSRVTGDIGYAQDLDGSGDYISFPSGCWLTGNDFGTQEVYVNFDVVTGIIMTQWNNDATNRFYFKLDGTKFFTHCDAGGSTQWIITSSGSAVVDTWYHVSLSMQLDNVQYKVDNLIVGSDDSCNMPSVDVNEMLTIRFGSRFDGYAPDFLDGTVDEIRISGIARSESWLNATSHTQHQTSGFLTWGDEQEYVPPNNPPTITSWNADTESGATSGWDWNNNDLQVDWVIADDESDTLTLLWTFSKGGTPSDPTTGSYNGRITGIESGSYTMNNQDLNWDSGDWSNYRGTVNFKFRLHDGTEYSTTIETDTLTGGIDGTDPDTTIMDQSDSDEGIDSIWGTATDTVCYVDHVDIYIKNTTDGTWWVGDSWSTETWLSAFANDTFDSSNENWNYDSSSVTWDRKSYEIGAKTTDESDRVDSTPATDTFTLMINYPPIQSNEIPVNGSINIDLTPELSVYCTDSHNDNLNATWWSNSSGDWIQFASNWTSFASGTTIRQTNENFTNYRTTYYWSVNLTHGIEWYNKTYHFTTKIGWLPNQPLAWLIRNATGVTIFRLLMSGGLDITGSFRFQGSSFLGNTDTDNFVHINEKGVISLQGDARIYKEIIVGSTNIHKGSSSPDDGYVNAIVHTLDFDKTTTQHGHYNTIIPRDMAEGTDILLEVDWFFDDVEVGHYVTWEMEYLLLSDGDDPYTSSTTIYQKSMVSTGNNDKQLHTTFNTPITGATTDETLLLRFSRDSDGTYDTDDLDQDARLLVIHLHYIADKLG